MTEMMKKMQDLISKVDNLTEENKSLKDKIEDVRTQSETVTVTKTNDNETSEVTGDTDYKPSGKSKSKTSKRYELSKANIERKAKAIYYHENKADPEIRSTIVNKLKSVGMLKMKKVLVGNTVYETENIPWKLVRDVTDEKFLNLIENEDPVADAYLKKAIEALKDSAKN